MLQDIKTILDALNDSNPHAKIQALDTIGTMKPANAIEIITPYLLDDTSDDVRNIAIQALSDLGYVESAVDELAVLLQNENIFLRDSVAEALLELNRPRLMEVWKKALNDSSQDVRDIAAQAIANL